MAKPNKKERIENRYLINDEIKLRGEVRLLTQDESIVMDFEQAKRLSREKALDLILINPTSNPPIVRLCDFGKFIYELKKKEKQIKQAPKPLKEIQLRVNIAEHDLETKAKQAMKFLNDGSKVKVVLTMRGRELTRRDENKKAMYEFLAMVEDVGVPEFMPKDEGNKTTTILKRKK